MFFVVEEQDSTYTSTITIFSKASGMSELHTKFQIYRTFSTPTFSNVSNKTSPGMAHRRHGKQSVKNMERTFAITSKNR